MNHEQDAPRPKRERDEKLLVMTGCLGLLAAAFVACSSGDDATSSSTTDAGTTTSESDATTTSTADASTTTSLGCTTSDAVTANTAAVVTAAQALYASLTTAQQSTIQLAASLEASEQWSNLPTNAISRNGVKIGDMSAEAQAAALALAAAATGTAGDTMFKELRAADQWLVTDAHAGTDGYGEGLYYFAFVGTPSTTSSWQLQIAGHHLAYNFTYNGACPSATPMFLGVEPTTWTDGATAHAPMETQRAASVALIQAVASDSNAVLAGTFTDVVNGPTNSNGKGDSRYPLLITYPTGTTGRGVNVGGLPAATQALVKTAIEAWVKNAADGLSSAILADYESDAALAETYVGYSGATDLTTQTSYFRIDGPRVWIEVTIQGGILYQNRVHYHTIWRDKLADYGAEYKDADAGTAGSGTGIGGGDGGMPPGDGGMMPPGDGGAPPALP